MTEIVVMTDVGMIALSVEMTGVTIEIVAVGTIGVHMIEIAMIDGVEMIAGMTETAVGMIIDPIVVAMIAVHTTTAIVKVGLTLLTNSKTEGLTEVSTM